METKNDAVICICSRLKSNRLQEKAIHKIAGVPVITHIVERIKDSGYPIVMAVPSGDYPKFKQILGERSNVSYYCGFDNSPLHRMAEAVRVIPGVRYVIRITHDDMLIDSKTMIDLVNKVRESGAGYGITPSILEGAGVEVISVENLLHAADMNIGNIEHISYYVRGANLPNTGIVRMEPRAEIRRDYRLTIDYQEDATVVHAILSHLGPMADNDSVVKFLDDHKEILNYNRLPLVTFYTCAKDAAGTIKNTMDSLYYLFCTENPNIEYIVIDDGSTDETCMKALEFLSSCSDSFSNRTKIYSNQSNLGLASSSNFAISKARGRYVMRVDADDRLVQGAWKTIKDMIEYAERHDIAVVYPSYFETHTIDIRGDIMAGKVFPGKEYHHAGCALMKKQLINEILFKDGIRHWDGIELYKRIKDRFPVGYTNDPLFYYLKRYDSLSASKGEDRAEVLESLRVAHGNDTETSSYVN